MRLKCPYCGERDQSEFSYLGDARVVRPAASDGLEAFHDYVYIRDNPAGEHLERWYHGVGCRAWLDVTRNVVTHEVIAVAPAARGSRAGGAA